MDKNKYIHVWGHLFIKVRTYTQFYFVAYLYLYYNKFNMFLAFCFHYQIDIYNYHVNHSISCINFLACSGLANPTITTYISAIKAFIYKHSILQKIILIVKLQNLNKKP